MRSDTAAPAELAAIAAAYLIVARRRDVAMPCAPPSRWRFAERLPDADVRRIAPATSRWNAAGRLDV